MYIPSVFRAYESRGFGAVETVVVLNSKTPVPLIKPEQLLVRVASAATNQVDVKLVEIPFVAKKLLPESNLPSEINPLRVGLDFAGTVVHVGDNATSSFQVGDEVYGLPRLDSMGSFAEYIAIDAELVAHKPKDLSFNEAAAIPCTAQTSYQALIDAGKLQAGQRLLVLGGSSATGSFAIQIAKNIGATVITTTSARNIELVKSYGANQVIDYTSNDWADVLEANSIDLIYDCGMEPESWNDRAQRVLKKETGRFVTIGQPAVDILNSSIGASFQRFHTKISALCLNKLTALIEEGKLKPTIDSVFPFEQLPAALVKQKSQRARGKIVIEIDGKQPAGGP